MRKANRSIKGQYAFLFKTIYRFTLNFFFIAIIWLIIEGIMIAIEGIERHDEISREHRDRIERKYPTSKRSEDKTESSLSEENE